VTVEAGVGCPGTADEQRSMMGAMMGLKPPLVSIRWARGGRPLRVHKRGHNDRVMCCFRVWCWMRGQSAR
jgi:hypothetical protein